MYKFLFIFSLLYCSYAIAQIKSPKDLQKLKIKSPNELQQLENSQISKYYIASLKKGALLVRLKTQQQKIDILKKHGQNDLANKIELEQKEENQSIINAFESNFNFCPVYYFYSHDSKFVNSNILDSVAFIDENLNINLNIDFKQTTFLVAEFAKIKQDTVIIQSENNSIKNYSGGTNFGFGALIIKSPQIIQLSHPFPFYTRTLSTLPLIRRSHNTTVKMMNKQLVNYYSSN